MGSPEAAVAAHNEAVKLAPTRARNHFLLGKAYHHMEFLQEAISCYQRAIHINSRFTSAHYSLGLAYRDTGDVRRALQAFQTVLEIDPFHTESRMGYCHMLYVKQNTVAAESCLLNVLEITPSSAAAAVLAGQVYLKKKNHKRSLAYFRSALASSPNNPIARYMSSALIGKESNDEWRLLYLTDYYDLNSYHYESSVAQVLKSSIYNIIRRTVQDHLPEACHEDLQSRRNLHDGFDNVKVDLVGDKECQACDTKIGGDRLACEATYCTRNMHNSNRNAPLDSEMGKDSSDEDVGSYMDRSSDDESHHEYGMYSDDEKSLYVLDLGSGAGSLCHAFINHTSTRHVEMIGADISQRMNAKALQRNCYKEILHVDLSMLLNELVDSEFDVITAVDVLHHMGDLSGVLRSARGIIRSGGLFIFTVEVLDGSSSQNSSFTGNSTTATETTSVTSNIGSAVAAIRDYSIFPTGVYMHREGYISQLATNNKYTIVVQEKIKLPRFDMEGNVVPGVLYVLRAGSGV